MTVVAVLAYPEPMMYAAAVAAGAATCVAFDAEPRRLVTAMSASLEGDTVMPTDIASQIAQQAVATIPSGETNEVQWLRDMAGGATVAALAARYGYSEREIYRHLRRFYDRIGASGRVDAIERAIHLGLM